jgi:hypothetical protein
VGLVKQDGFAIVPKCLDEDTVELLSKEFDDARYPERKSFVRSKYSGASYIGGRA